MGPQFVPVQLVLSCRSSTKTFTTQAKVPRSRKGKNKPNMKAGTA